MIEPERFNREVKPPDNLYEADNPGRPKLEPNPKRMKKVFNWIKDTISGENKAGETIHGVLDLLPIPNQIIAKGFSYLFKGNVSEAREELGKLLTVRNGVALLLSIAYLTGLIGIDDVKALIEALGDWV